MGVNYNIWLKLLYYKKISLFRSDTCYSAQTLVKIMIDLNVGQLSAANDFENAAKLPRFYDVVQVFKMLMNNMKGIDFGC